MKLKAMKAAIIEHQETFNTMSKEFLDLEAETFGFSEKEKQGMDVIDLYDRFKAL